MKRYWRALSDPVGLVYRALDLGAPTLLRQRFERLSRKKGLDRLYLSLSFDCDTDRDAECVIEVDQKLEKMGIQSAYAVPAELLMRNRSAYTPLINQGREFLNHGFREHTQWDSAVGRNVSTFFYDQVSLDDVEKDIQSGDRVLREEFGVTPKGFRTPHFGTFQGRRQLKFLIRLLRKMGYQYSSSTLPVFAVKHGPYVFDEGMLEIPVSGTFSRPLKIYDSWSFFEAPGRGWKPGEFKLQAEKWVETARNKMAVGIINLYADPSQVADRGEFFEAMKLLSSVAVPIGLGQFASKAANFIADSGQPSFAHERF